MKPGFQIEELAVAAAGVDGLPFRGLQAGSFEQGEQFRAVLLM